MRPIDSWSLVKSQTHSYIYLQENILPSMLSQYSRSQTKICKLLSELKTYCSNCSSVKTRLEKGSHVLRLLGVNLLTQRMSEHSFNMEYHQSWGQVFLRTSFHKFVNGSEKWNEGINLNLWPAHSQKNFTFHCPHTAIFSFLHFPTVLTSNGKGMLRGKRSGFVGILLRTGQEVSEILIKNEVRTQEISRQISQARSFRSVWLTLR